MTVTSTLLGAGMIVHSSIGLLGYSVLMDEDAYQESFARSILGLSHPPICYRHIFTYMCLQEERATADTNRMTV